MTELEDYIWDPAEYPASEPAGPKAYKVERRPRREKAVWVTCCAGWEGNEHRPFLFDRRDICIPCSPKEIRRTIRQRVGITLPAPCTECQVVAPTGRRR